MQPLIDMQVKLREMAGAPKRAYAAKPNDPELVAQLESASAGALRQALLTPQKTLRQEATRAVKSKLIETLGAAYAERQPEVADVLDDLKRRLLRDLVLAEGRRVDGRRFDEIRPITCEVGVLPKN